MLGDLTEDGATVPDDDLRGAEWQRHLAQVADGAADGIVVCDGECRIVHANRAAERVFALTSEELLGRYCDDPAWTVACEGRPLDRTELACHRALDTGEVVQATERTVLREDGSSVDVLVSASPLQDDQGAVVGVITSFTDVSELKRAEEDIREADESNRSLLRLYRSLGSARTYREIVAALRPEMERELGYTNITLSLLQDDTDEILVLADGGAVGGFFRTLMQSDERYCTRLGDDEVTSFPVTGDPHLEMLTAATDIYIDEDLSAPDNPRIYTPQQKKIVEILDQHTIVAVPLSFAGEKVGYFILSTHGDEGIHVPSPKQLDYLRMLANHVAVAIDRVRFLGKRREAEEALRRTLDEVESALDGIVRALASTTGERDPYTASHQERVAHLAGAIAEELGLPDATVEGIRVAAVLHDIGKIAVPTEILAKPSKLTEMELGIVRTHSEVGRRLLDGVPFHTPVATIVQQHHERLDGSGYPDGLTGDEILPEAKILAVADVVEAMASHRPYRPSRGLDAAIKEVETGAGTKYDREAVHACVRVLTDKAFVLD